MGDGSESGRSPYGRKSGPQGPDKRKYRRVCLWCGIEFQAARPAAKTHTARCRVALARYVAKHGRPPMFPFGAILAKKGKR